MGARRKLNHLSARIAVSEAAAWTGRRFYGGHYRVIPNGVDAAGGRRAGAARVRAPGEPLRIVFVGQAVERKGLPVLLRAFEALRRQVPAELTVVGVEPEELAPMLLDPEGVTALGRVGDAEKRAALEAADVLCAPSLGGESFGMVLTEAFAAGTPVVASDIAGYRDVVHARRRRAARPARRRHARWPRRCATSRSTRRARAHLAAGAARSAERYAWPRVAAEVAATYEDARAVEQPEGTLARAAVRVGTRAADGSRSRRPAAAVAGAADRGRDAARLSSSLRRGLLAGAALAAAGGALLALERIGMRPIGQALLASSPTWVLVALGLMCLSMCLRAVSWHAILKAALPDALPRFADAMQGTSIGVLMSATLPARLGEPSRALIVSRRLGRARDRLPVVLGTLVSQTLLNVLALRDPRRRDVRDDRAVRRPPAGADLVRAGAVRGARASCSSAPALLRSGLPSRSARVARWLAQARGAAARVRHGLVVFRRARLGVRSPRARSSARGACSGSPATCCWSRCTSTAPPTWARPPPCCSRST